jgi:hypothetical protein
MQSCNGRQAVDVLLLAGKGLNAFSVLLKLQQWLVLKVQHCRFLFARELAKLRGYTTCFVVVVAVAVVVGLA